MTTERGGIAGLPAALDLAAFEHTNEGSFHPVGPLPAWASTTDLLDQFPILEIFLPDCETAWATLGASALSDVWTESCPDGIERYLQAVATSSDGRRFLVIKSLPQALFTYQQLAHDVELAKDKIERLSRELEIKRREAERATQAKSDFLARMSHEIRTPLNAVIGLADVLSATPLTPDQRRCVEVSQRNGIALLNLINDILDLSKVESGKVELESTNLDLRDVIARALEVVETRANNKGLWLRHTIAEGVPVNLIGDPNRLRQVLINLLGNSIKFTETGGIEVRVEKDPDNPQPGRLRFAVTDTGIGIPSGKVNTVFESFSQADTSTTRKYGGTGLGLTISKQLIELMEGRVWIESVVGQGSTFFFTAAFGIGEARPATVDQKKSAEELERLAGGLRILLTDDSEDNRFLILSYLKRTNASVEIAENGQIAVDLFARKHYDIVLMDVEMPVMDGHTATREIRRLEKERNAKPTPILVLTAHAFADMAATAFETGFTDLLTKPIRSITLLEAVAKYAPGPHLSSGVNVPHTATLPNTATLPSRDRKGAVAILITVDPDMADVVPAYLEKRRAEASLYLEHLTRNDFESIRMMAHKMKGTGAGYGFDRLTELGSELEKAAKQSDADQIRARHSELINYLDSIQLEYKG